MESILLVVHVLVALAIVGLIMLQQGKGAEMGASFGSGASQTVFGAAGSGNFFSKATALLVAVFFATSLTLAMLSKESVDVVDDGIPDLVEVDAPVTELEQDDIPEPSDVAESDVPEAMDGEVDVPEAVDTDPSVEPETEN